MSEEMDSDIVARLRCSHESLIGDAYWEVIYAERKEAADEIERPRERCEAYKGQVSAGADEIELLRGKLYEARAAAREKLFPTPSPSDSKAQR